MHNHSSRFPPHVYFFYWAKGSQHEPFLRHWFDGERDFWRAHALLSQQLVSVILLCLQYMQNFLNWNGQAELVLVRSI